MRTAPTPKSTAPGARPRHSASRLGSRQLTASQSSAMRIALDDGHDDYVARERPELVGHRYDHEERHENDEELQRGSPRRLRDALTLRLGPDETVHHDQRAQQAPRQVDENGEADRQRPPIVGVRGSRRDRLRHEAGETSPGNCFSRHLAGHFRDNSQHAHQHECERQHPDEQAVRERAGHDAAADIRVSLDPGQRDVDRAVALALRVVALDDPPLVLGDPVSRCSWSCVFGLLHGGAVCRLEFDCREIGRFSSKVAQ